MHSQNTKTPWCVNIGASVHLICICLPLASPIRPSVMWCQMHPKIHQSTLSVKLEDGHNHWQMDLRPQFHPDHHSHVHNQFDPTAGKDPVLQQMAAAQM